MTSYVSAELRRIVESRANGQCEYCLIHESDTFLGCQVDHIISEKHGGPTEADNLAIACTYCNQSKGTDIGSLASSNREFTRFFNPRTDDWENHFSLKGAVIEPLSPIGQTTANILQFNKVERVIERETLIQLGRYPLSNTQ